MSEEHYVRDIEEPEEVLDSSPGDPIDFWERKQRELVTSVVDYNLATLNDLILSNSINLSPEYQRRFRWDPLRQSRLIESFLMNVPVPPVFLNEDEYGAYSVIDGKQRLTAISSFLQGRFLLTGLQVFSDINDRSFYDLPPRLQTVLRTRPTLRAVIILRQSDVDLKFEVFQRLNTGGVRLNPQEIRNSTYPGPLNNTILALSTNPLFHKLLGVKSPGRSAIYQEMRDAEFVLRYFTFRDTWQTFSGGMKRQMDRYMASNRDMPADRLEELKADFVLALRSVDACFGDYAFRRWEPQRNRWRKQVLASLFDAQIFGCRGVSPQAAIGHQDAIVSEFKKLFDDRDFRRAIDSATNAPSYFQGRIHAVRDLVNSIVGYA